MLIIILYFVNLSGFGWGSSCLRIVSIIFRSAMDSRSIATDVPVSPRAMATGGSADVRVDIPLGDARRRVSPKEKIG